MEYYYNGEFKEFWVDSLIKLTATEQYILELQGRLWRLGFNSDYYPPDPLFHFNSLKKIQNRKTLFLGEWQVSELDLSKNPDILTRGNFETWARSYLQDSLEKGIIGERKDRKKVQSTLE
jgi:hypothetical protein